MKYPITDLYVAETLKRAAAQCAQGSSVYPAVIELARFFELRHWLAQLTMDDFECLTQYAHELAQRATPPVNPGEIGGMEHPSGGDRPVGYVP